MEEKLKPILKDVEGHMKKSVEHLEGELMKIHAGRANPGMLDGITVDYYGTPTPINQVGTIAVTDPRTLTVQPWEKNMLSPVERAIQAANLGLNPTNDGILLRIHIPPPNEERRKNLVKQAKADGEKAKVAIRHMRDEGRKKVDELVKEGLSEDWGKWGREEIEIKTKKYQEKVDEILKHKEEEIMTV